jgi:endonuclease YncB( thermonuclease family)
MKRLCALILLTIFCSVLSIRANTLYGRVVEVQDGMTMTVENTGRRVKVALKLAAPPDKGQPFADVAQQHLQGMVLGRQVAVEYTGLGADALLLGRVFCDNRDVGLQMIRDGVAWFDKSYEAELNEAERRVYADSEQAARNEHRGIWQDPAPVAPWEWRKTSADKSTEGGRVRISAERNSATNPASAKTPATYAKPSPPVKAAGQRWPLFSPSGNLFSIRVPGGGKEFAVELDLKKGGKVDANFYWVNHLKIAYIVLWANGPRQDDTLDALFEKTVNALNDAAAAHGLPCEFVPEKDAPMKGFTGQRYNVRDCYFKGAIRNYFKIEGQTLKVFYVGVMSEDPNNPEIKAFLDSFTIN